MSGRRNPSSSRRPGDARTLAAQRSGWSRLDDSIVGSVSHELMSRAGKVAAQAVYRSTDMAPRAEMADATVAELAGAMLQTSADFLEAATATGQEAADALNRVARICRKMSGAVARSPFGSARQVLEPDDLSGRFHTDGERAWSNATVAAFLLADVARVMDMARVQDSFSRRSLDDSAATLRQLEVLLRLAPGSRPGPRLEALLPFLRHVRSMEQEPEHPRTLPTMVDNVMGEPEFRALCEEVYLAWTGRDLNALPLAAQSRWAQGLAYPWLRRRLAPEPLESSDVEQIRHAVDHPRQAWARAPLIDGRWSELAPDDAVSILCLISAHHRTGPANTPFACAWLCDRARSRPLICYNGTALLVEVQGQVGSGRVGIASFILTDDDVWPVIGESSCIHELNSRVGPQLFDSGSQIDYVRLFLNSTRSGGQRFQSLERPDALHELSDDPRVRSLCAAHARPIEPSGFDDEGRWLFTAIIHFQRMLFRSVLAVTPDGQVEMVDDRLIEQGLDVRPEAMIGPFVFLAGDS